MNSNVFSSFSMNSFFNDTDYENDFNSDNFLNNLSSFDDLPSEDNNNSLNSFINSKFDDKNDNILKNTISENYHQNDYDSSINHNYNTIDDIFSQNANDDRENQLNFDFQLDNEINLIEEKNLCKDKIKLNKGEFLNKKRENPNNLITFLSKKTNTLKGRPKKEGKNNNEVIYTHKKESKDNICQKIKGYLLELYRTEFNKIIEKYGFGKLYKIDASIHTKKFKGQDNLNLLDTSMLTIFNNITKKYNVNPNHNIEIIEKLVKKNNNEINNYLNMTFGQFFELATNQNKDESLLEKNIFEIIKEKYRDEDSDYKNTLLLFCNLNTYKDFWNTRASRLN